MATDAFFTRDGDSYIPGAACRGPWNPNSLHGRVIVGLAGFELERLHGGEAWMPVRLTVDMYRLPDFSPITAVTRVLRAGKRIKVVDCELLSGGVSVARGTCQFLVRSENASGVTWSPPVWGRATWPSVWACSCWTARTVTKPGPPWRCASNPWSCWPSAM